MAKSARAGIRSGFLVAIMHVAPYLIVPEVAWAQGPGTVTGTVSDADGAPLIGAEITHGSTSLRAITDEKGIFRIVNVPVGTGTMNVRRLGFIPSQLAVQVLPGREVAVAVRLMPIAARLEPIVVRGERINYTGRLAGYYQRLERKTTGYFITREQIDRENPRRLKELLRHIPGITEVRGRGRSSGIRMRGRSCSPLVWMDGVPMPAGEVDLDSFSPNTLQGVELYLGSTTAPVRYTYTRDASSCGTILLWSRGPDTDPFYHSPPLSAELERLVASASVFTSDEVDRRAAIDPTHPLELAFPPSLFAGGVKGLVVAEFVIDTTGRVENETIGIVSSTHPLFTAAVRSALAGAVYIPAVKDGQRVRQVVQQPFDFRLARQSKGL